MPISQRQESLVSAKSQTEEESVNMSQRKNILERKFSEDIQSPLAPKELSFKDIVKRFDFQQTHTAKLLRKPSGPNSVCLNKVEEEYCAPSHSHLIRHESVGLRKGRSLPANNAVGFVDTLQKWVQRYKSVTQVRQRDNQRYGRKMPLPREIVPQAVEVDDSVDLGRCLSISEGQQFWDDLVNRQNECSLRRSASSLPAPLKRIDYGSCMSPRGVVDTPALKHYSGVKGEVSQTTTASSSLSTSLSTLDRIEEWGRDDVSVTGGATFQNLLLATKSS